MWTAITLIAASSTSVLVPLTLFAGFAVLLLAYVVSTERAYRRAGFDRGRAVPRQPQGISLGPSAVTFVGGSRIGWVNASWPLARISFDSSNALIAGAAGRAWIDRASVEAIELIPNPFITTIRFASSTGRFDGVLFVPMDARGMVGALIALGWPVAVPGAPLPGSCPDPPRPPPGAG